MQQDVVDQDTIHHLFPGLNKLLDFQRKFLIEFEQQYELPWDQQRWGKCFIVNVCRSPSILVPRPSPTHKFLRNPTLLSTNHIAPTLATRPSSRFRRSPTSWFAVVQLTSTGSPLN